jgi:prevent-host-death family protein
MDIYRWVRTHRTNKQLLQLHYVIPAIWSVGWPSWPTRATLIAVSSYSIGEAKTQLSKLVHEAEDGEEVVVRRGQKPVARIVAITSNESPVRRVPGRMRGRISMREDFDEWPPDIARTLGISD